jgi:tetratricopeptide (TPR) repeat protein
MRTLHRVVVVTLLILGAAAVPLDRSAPATVDACGPFTSFPVFTPAGAPAHASYFAGDLGILQPTYARRYLLVAWRTLNGRPLTNGEQHAFTHAPERVADPVQVWLGERGKVHSLQGINYLNREARIAQTYAYFVNCGDSGFLTAAKTLEARRAALGGPSPEVVAWAEAQDVVFSNCGRSSEQAPAIPAPLGADASAAARADRAYQIASAQFYAGLFADAETSFAAISHDVSSPWRTWGSYLAARAAIRQGTMGGPDAEGDPASLRRAEERLNAALRDPSLSKRHAAAQQLLEFIEARTRPNDVLARAARALGAPGNADRFHAHLSTYEYLLNRFVSGDTEKLESGITDPRGATDLLDWVLTFQGRAADEDAAAHALQRWRTSGSSAWLVAALSNAPSDGRQQLDLLTAAAAVDPTSPAYATVAFHRGRLLLQSGHQSEARAVLDRALAANHLPRSTVNLLKAARLATARTLDEYLSDAPRSPVDNADDSTPEGAKTIDRDVVDALNQRLPLSTIRRAGESSILSASIRREIVLAAFTRAVLLERAQTVRALLPRVARMEPLLAGALTPLRTARDDAALGDEGALLLVRHPGLRPFLTAGREREGGALASIDNLRDNWWCAFAGDGIAPYETRYWRRGPYERVEGPQMILHGESSVVTDPSFLTAEERVEAETERQQLKQIDAGPSELGRRVLAWARAHPADPRVPEALHLVVRATRYGCTNDRTGAVSKAAFTLLHGKYPASPWAKKTPLWFK